MLINGRDLVLDAGGMKATSARVLQEVVPAGWLKNGDNALYVDLFEATAS